MNKQEILDVVREYIQNENAKYAVLIDAPWGAGKTYLYKKYLADEIACIENGKDNRKSNGSSRVMVGKKYPQPQCLC